MLPARRDSVGDGVRTVSRRMLTIMGGVSAICGPLLSLYVGPAPIRLRQFPIQGSRFTVTGSLAPVRGSLRFYLAPTDAASLRS